MANIVNGKSQILIDHLNKKQQEKYLYQINSGDFVNIRHFEIFNNKLYFSGHYRKSLTMFEKKISNSGNHSLFFG
jgi:hypothetical protein